MYITSEKAIERLAKNCLDEAALAAVFKNNQKEIEQAVGEWFGQGSVKQDAVSRVLVKISKSAMLFHPELQSAETFIVGCANAECSTLFEQAIHRLAFAHYT